MCVGFLCQGMPGLLLSLGIKLQLICAFPRFTYHMLNEYCLSIDSLFIALYRYNYKLLEFCYLSAANV